MRFVKSPNDAMFAAALFSLAAVLYWTVSGLRLGTLLRMGPGFLPTILCILVAATGATILLRSLLVAGDRLYSWPVRPLVFVLGGPLAFALLLETLGLVVAMPVLVATVSLADRDCGMIETILLATALTLFSAVVFVVALGLPLPLWPAGWTNA